MMHYLAVTFMFWLALSIYWRLSARGAKQDVYRQRFWVRSLTWTAPFVSYALIYVPQLSVGWLGLRCLPHGSAIQLIGVFLCALGLAFAVWARHVLGVNWSGIVTFKEGHELMQAGPYGLVRHPIYTGVILGLFGSAVVLGEVRGFVALAITVIAFLKKSADEERIMEAQFPDEYPEYRARVRKLAPFLF